jgi:hypothetical protein
MEENTDNQDNLTQPIENSIENVNNNTNEYIDKLTLELLLNKNHYSKYLHKTDPKRHDEFKTYKSNLRKYSIDIVDITSQLIENPNKMYNNDISDTFKSFVTAIFKYIEMKDIENTNEYNNNNDDNNEDDVMFGNCDNENETEVENQPMKSFWSKEKVVKKHTKLTHYDMNMFQKPKSK